MQELLEKSKILLGEGKIPSFLKHIARQQPKLLKPYAELVVKSTESDYIEILINSKVVSLADCLAILRKLEQDKAKRVSQVLGAIHLD